jgi:hypothetical protein
MKPHSEKKRIKAAIVRFLEPFRPGDTLRSDEIVKAVKRDMGIKYLYSDTVLRYCRELRKYKEINFTCIHKHDRIFEILEPGQPHSL